MSNLEKVPLDKRNSTSLVVLLIVAIMMIGVIVIIPLSTNSIAIASSSSGSKGSLEQIPSQTTDFPDNDPNVVSVTVFNAKKDSIGTYHVRGEIKNVSEDELQYVQVTAHFYDNDGNPIGVTSCCYTQPDSIESGHTATFDSFADKDELSGKPSSFRLSFDWQ